MSTVVQRQSFAKGHGVQFPSVYEVEASIGIQKDRQVPRTILCSVQVRFHLSLSQAAADLQVRCKKSVLNEHF